MTKQASRAVQRRLHIKQAEATEKALTNALAPVIAKQVQDIVRGLREHGEAVDTVSDVFDAKDYKHLLIDAIFPILAAKSLEAAAAQMMVMGADPRKREYRGI